MLDFEQFKVLTFDCYGTLIDWENGILDALKPLFIKYGVNISDEEILEKYAGYEAKLEVEYLKYKEVLKKATESFAEEYQVSLNSDELNLLSGSVKNWQPFPDTVDALHILKKKYKLAIISNIDNDLFHYSEKLLNTKFDYLITAEDIGSYKPSLNNFQAAIKKIGVEPGKILHIAQSIYHDIIPAKESGLSNVWVNRRKNKQGFGATPPAKGLPNLEVTSLNNLVYLMDLGDKKFSPRLTDTAGGIVLNKKGQVLVVSQHGTSWSLPKGHIDPGEEKIEAAIREIYEESGVNNLSLVKELGSYKRFRIGLEGTEDNSELKTIFMYLFKTEQEQLEPIDPENPDAIWVEKDEVADLLTHYKDKQFFIDYLGQI